MKTSQILSESDIFFFFFLICIYLRTDGHLEEQQPLAFCEPLASSERAKTMFGSLFITHNWITNSWQFSLNDYSLCELKWERRKENMAILQKRLYLWMLSFFPSFFSSSFFLFFPSPFLSLPVLLIYNWHTALYKFEVYKHNDLTYIHHEMITTIYLVKVYVSYTYKNEIETNIFFVMKTLRIYSLSAIIIQ